MRFCSLMVKVIAAHQPGSTLMNGIKVFVSQYLGELLRFL